MKRALLILCVLLCCTLLSSCVKQVEFKSEDKSKTFMFEDINGFDISKYKIDKYNDGKEYFFSKTDNILHGHYSHYGVNLRDKYENLIKLKSIFSIQKTEKGAKELYNSNKRTASLITSKYMTDVSLKEYNVDEAYKIIMDDYFEIVLRKRNLFYQVTIDGISIKEDQIKKGLSNKMDFLIKNGVGEYKVN